MSFMNIDLRSLKHVVVLARILNFTKAAQELCITQSALSRSIQAVERNSHVKLFDRDRSRVQITVAGRDIVERAAQLLRDSEELDRALRSTANAEIGEACFGIGPLAAQALLPSVLPKTFIEKPELRTRIIVRDVEALTPALIREDIELAIIAQNDIMDNAPLNSQFLGWFPISLIVRTGHPLLKSGENHSRLNFPILSPGQFSRLDKWPTRLRRYLNGPLHIIEEYGVASRITEQTDAIWLSSSFAAMPDIRAGRLKELEPPKPNKPFRVRMMIYTSSRRSLSPAAEMLKRLFIEKLGTLQDGAI
jgi:DNA-binding transcriptional LysR family regulator